MMIPLHNFLELSKKGFLAGPKEKEKEFLDRVFICKKLFKENSKNLDCINENSWKSIKETIKNIFDFSPDWIMGYYDNAGISPWHGAVTWIKNFEGKKIPYIQIPKKLKKRKLFFLYSLKEILIHEAVHAVRVAFDENKYEEIFAYHTSKNLFRKIFGPIFRSANETKLFLVFMLSSFVNQLIFFYFDKFFFLYLSFFIPLITVAFFVLRVIKDHIFLKLALVKVKKIFNVNPMFIAIRLTDKEIKLFSYKSVKFLKKYINEQKSIRWKQILFEYKNFHFE